MSISTHTASATRIAPHTIHEVVPALRRDAPALAATLAAAFREDPVAAHCLPDPARRARRLEQGFTMFARRLYLPHGACLTTPARDGVALWVPPERWRLSRGAQMRLMPGMVLAYRRDLPRVLELLELMESRHPQEPHFYLPFIGVAPPARNAGIGSALLRPVLRRCDREGLPAYLEATSPHNRRLYERHGFAVVEELRAPDAGPPLWLMWREPDDSLALS